jgi:SAM-dependent methyltransferase
MVNQAKNTPDVFDQEWKNALEDENSRYLIYPSLEADYQFDIFEWIKAEQILEILRNNNITSGRILEYGCGAAGISSYLGERGFEAHICDLSIAALKIAEINARLHTGNNRLSSKLVANALRLPYQNDQFDVVMSFGLLEHFETEEVHHLLSESIRVLKPGGYFIADIVPGIKIINIRTIGVFASYFGALLKNVAKGQYKIIKELRQEYFDPFYESVDKPEFWQKIMEMHGFMEPQVLVCRVFPPLALSGKAEAFYAYILKKTIRLQQNFDKKQNWLTRRWGWTYLTYGSKGCNT